VLSCYVSLCSEFRVAYFFSFCCAILLFLFMYWVPCCSFHNFSVCCPVMYLYVLRSVLLISLVFFVLSWYVSLCSEFRVAYFFSLFVLSYYVSLCSDFRVAYFFCFFRVVLLCIFMFCFPCCSFFFLFRVGFFFIFFRVVLLCIFMFWVPCCSFHNCFSCCPVMFLYVLSSVLLIFLGFFCVVLLCVFMFWVPCCSFL
jgi:hypothetical protein